MLALSVVPAAFADSLGPNVASTASEGPSAPAWSFPSNAIGSDDVYTTTPLFVGNTSNYLYLTGFDFAIPSDVTIDGIVVSIERSRDGGDPPVVHDASVRLMKGGAMTGDNKATSTSWPQAATIGDLSEDHGAVDDLWGTTWTPAEINAAGFGVAISAFREAGGTTGTRLARIDDVNIVVSFTDAAAPDASFSADPTSVDEADTVDFDASASTDNVAIATYDWDFGDGTVLLDGGATPSHTYDDDDDDDSYTVTLTVTDTSDNTDETTMDIEVSNTNPLLSVTTDPTGETTTTSDLSCLQESSDAAGENDPLDVSYQWSEDLVEIDGETSDTLDDALTTKGHTYTCEVTVTDDDGGETSLPASVDVINTAVVVEVLSPDDDVYDVSGDPDDLEHWSGEQDIVFTTDDADDDPLDLNVYVGSSETPACDNDEENEITDVIFGEGTYTCVVDTAVYYDDEYTVLVTAYDGDEEGSGSAEVLFDNTAPEFDEYSSIDTETDVAPLSVSFATPTATDEMDSAPEIACSRESGDSFDFGTTVVECTATDDTGNVGEMSFEITVGHTPVVEILSPIDTDDWSGTHEVVFTATDADDDELSLEVTLGIAEEDVLCDNDEETIAPDISYDEESGEYSCELDTTTRSDGDAYIDVTADDGRDGGEFEDEVDFTIDNTQPESWFTDWDDPAIGEVTFYGSSSDETSDVTGVEVQVDDGEWLPATCDFIIEAEDTDCSSWYFDWTAPAEDGVEHTFRSRATDSADVPNVEDDFWNDWEARWEEEDIDEVNELSATVETLPTVTSVVTADTNGNQRIDRLVVTFDEAINDSKLDELTADGWDVYDTDGENITADYVSESVITGDVVNDNILWVNVDEIGTDDGDVTPWISYSQEAAEGCGDCSTHDLSGGLELEDGEWEATDGFSPPAPEGGSGGGRSGGGGGGGSSGSTQPVVETTETDEEVPDLPITTTSDAGTETPTGEETDGGSGLTDITGGAILEEDNGGAFDAITGAFTGQGSAGFWWLLLLILALIAGFGYWGYKKYNQP